MASTFEKRQMESVTPNHISTPGNMCPACSAVKWSNNKNNIIAWVICITWDSGKKAGTNFRVEVNEVNKKDR